MKYRYIRRADPGILADIGTNDEKWLLHTGERSYLMPFNHGQRITSKARATLRRKMDTPSS